MQAENHVARAVITVGEGRGFVAEGRLHRLVITAAHCLPFFPPCVSFSDLDQRTYTNLLGRSDKSRACGRNVSSSIQLPTSRCWAHRIVKSSGRRRPHIRRSSIRPLRCPLPTLREIARRRCSRYPAS